MPGLITFGATSRRIGWSCDVARFRRPLLLQRSSDAPQLIRHEEMLPPSVRIRRSTSSPETASQRQVEPARLPQLLERELDWIVMKALEKDRARRYNSPSDSGPARPA